MKLVTSTPRKLKLNTESLRVLNTADLQSIAGGKPGNTHTDLCTAGPCGTR